MASHANHQIPSAGDLAYETFYSAAIGGLVVALFFLALDLVAGQPLYTPSVLGSVLFLGADAASVEGVNFTAMALFTVAHLLGFGVIGFVSTLLVRRVERMTGGGFVPPTIALFVLLEGGFLVVSFLVPAVTEIVGRGMPLLANILAAVVMTLFLRHAHETGEAETRDEPGAAGGARQTGDVGGEW